SAPHHLHPRVPAAARRMRLDAERGASIAARTREPLFFRDHAQYAARLPEAAALIASDGVEARAFLPVLAGERLLGVVTLAWEAAREFDDDAVQTKTAIASYVAHALDRVRLLEERHRVATTLQAAMLTELPSVRSAELAATYASATRTGPGGRDWDDAAGLRH